MVYDWMVWHVMSHCGPSTSMGCVSPNKETIVSSMIQEFKSLENGHSHNGGSVGLWNDKNEDEQAAQCLVMLGISPGDNKHTPFSGDETIAISSLVNLSHSCSSNEVGSGEMPIDLKDLEGISLSQLMNLDPLSDESPIQTNANLTPRHDANLHIPKIFDSPSKTETLLQNILGRPPSADLPKTNADQKCIPPRCQSTPVSSTSIVSRAAEQYDSLLRRSRTSPTLHKEREELPPRMIQVAGVDIPAVSSPMLDCQNNYVFVSDAFQKFFNSKHWDEFKTILEDNCVVTLEVPVVDHCTVQNMVVMSVNDLNLLLTRNMARKEGFVPVTTLTTDPNGTMRTQHSFMKTGEERTPGQLSSGIKTRNMDCNDISYVQMDGQTLPAINTKEEEQFVRLADVHAKFVNPDSNSNVITLSQVNRLKNACLSLSILVTSCSSNKKSKLVAVAKSTRCEDLHIIPACELPKLIQYIRHGKLKKRRHSPNLTPTKRMRTNRVYVDDSSEAGESWDGESVSTSSFSTPSVHQSSDAKSKSNSYAGDTPLGDLYPPMATLVLKSVGDGKFTVKSPSTSPHKHAFSLSTRELIQEMRPCEVMLGVKIREEDFLVVVVSNWSGARGQMGKYWDNLFLCKNATCVQCESCSQFYSVSDFIGHSAQHKRPVPNSRIFTLHSNVSSKGYPLWAAFQEKLADFDLSHMSYKLPAKLPKYYKQRLNGSSDTLQPTRKGVLAMLKKGEKAVPTEPEDVQEAQVRKWLMNERMATLPASLHRDPYAPNPHALMALRRTLPASPIVRRPIQTSALDVVRRRRCMESHQLAHTFEDGQKSEEKEAIIRRLYDCTT